MDLSFVIVNYKSDRYLKECLASLKKASFSIEHEVVIVHNDPESPLAPDSFEPAANILVCQTAGNLGFARANNFGASLCTGRYLCFLNPDTVLLEGDFKKLFENFRSGEIGIVGPKLVTDRRLEAQPWSAGPEITFLETLRNNLPWSFFPPVWQSAEPLEVGWVSGACLFIESALFAELRGFDENFFMYFEDADLCRRARAKNKKVLFFPHFQVLHWGGRSKESTRQQKLHYYRSQDYYFHKYYGFSVNFLLKSLRKVFRKCY